jgi:glucosamine-6-phosphate deaminase
MESMQVFNAGQLAVKVLPSRAALGQAAAAQVVRYVSEILSRKGEVNIIFAAAPSQNELLSTLRGSTGFPWSRVNAFHMDEYVGLTPGAPQSFAQFLKDRLFDHVTCGSVNLINGNAADIHKECERYAELLRSFPPDIVCLGIGENTHLAFNDPHVADFDDPLLVKTVTLDERCRQQQVNDGCFAKLPEVPDAAITLTIPALFQGQYLVCSVPGPSKREAVSHTLHQAISAQYPSTILRRHAAATLFVDTDSYSNQASH